MYDMVRKRETPVRNRRVKTTATKRFSPSHGVATGAIPDPNWPPPELPKTETAMRRRTRRIRCAFSVWVGSKKHRVRGDISKGGARFLFPDDLEASEVVLELKNVRARARVIGKTGRTKKEQAYHAKFVVDLEGELIWNALVR